MYTEIMLTFFIALFILSSRQQTPTTMIDDTPSVSFQSSDTALKNTLSTVLTGVNNYQANNRGVLPTNWSTFMKTYLPKVTGYTFVANTETAISSPQKKTIYYSSGYTCSTQIGEIIKGSTRDIALRAQLSNKSVTCQSD